MINICDLLKKSTTYNQEKGIFCVIFKQLLETILWVHNITANGNVSSSSKLSLFVKISNFWPRLNVLIFEPHSRLSFFCKFSYELFLRNGWPAKGVKLYFQPRPLSEILTIANLWHTASKTWTWVESEFRLCWMKLCSSYNPVFHNLYFSRREQRRKGNI